MTLKLLMPAALNIVLSVVLYLLERKALVRNANYKVKQTVIGVLFGMAAIYATHEGVDIGGAIVNVRDASALCAGLIFGAPAGIIAGIIGGVYRYAAVFWNGAGAYTQLACSLSTILSGFIAAALRKFMFDDKKPVWIYGFGVGVVCEIIHMLMIFFTNMQDASRAFAFVEACTLPMILANGITVGVSVMAVAVIGREKLNLHKEQKQISETFQFWLIVCIAVAYTATSTFTAVLQAKISQKETEAVIGVNINDVFEDITDASDENLLNKTERIKEDYLNGGDLSDLAKKYNVIEVNIVNNAGIIENTNNKEYIGYNMADGEQSAEFLRLLDGKDTEFAQEYRPTSYDNKTYRKYGAVVLSQGGFIQVGYDASQFHDDINKYAGTVARNRHVGNNGFVAVCNSDFDIVTENHEYSGKNIKEALGIAIDPATMPEEKIFESTVYGKEYLCSFRFAEGYYIIGALPKTEAMFMKNVSVYVNVFMEIVIFAALFVLIYFLIKRIIIDNLKKVNNTLSQITDGNLNVTVDVRSNEEFASLSDDINHTVNTLKHYIAEAAARIDKELEFAKQIQYSALPSVFPPYPNRNDIDIYARMITAKEVGGDFYDFYLLDGNTLAFLVADVSGKGIPAAMFMMRAKTIIKDLAESGLEPAEIITKANKRLCENNDAGMFVTAWFGILDLKTGGLKFVNAGHNPPLLRHADGEYEYLKARGGMVLAGMEDIKYRQNEIVLSPHDSIFLYTDGVTEATDNENQLYGEKRLLEAVNGNIGKDSKQICEAVKADVDRFVGEAPQFDDITMLCLQVRYIQGDNKVTVIVDDQSMKVVQNFAEMLTEKLAVVPKVANKVNVAVDEVYSNIINYSGADTASVSYRISNGKLGITFEDNGIPYNPLEAAEPDITLSAEERKIGGLGIFIVKKMAESMEYSYENGKNVLKLTIALN